MKVYKRCADKNVKLMKWQFSPYNVCAIDCPANY